MGHYKSKCPKNKSKKATAKQSERKQDTVLMTVEGDVKPKDDIWIASSAASMHITNSKIGLYDVKDIHELVKLEMISWSMLQRLAGFLCKHRRKEERICLGKC